MENISFLEAWAHVAKSGSYWLWLILATFLASAVIYVVIHEYKKKALTIVHFLALFAVGCIFLLALLMRPAEVAGNTTKEQAARGVYIGY